MTLEHSNNGSSVRRLRIRTVTAGPGEPVRLVIVGELDRYTSERLRRTVADVLRGLAPTVLLIDVSAVSLVDFSGIRGLLVCRGQALAYGTRLSLVNPSPVVTRILEVTGLGKTFGSPLPAATRDMRHAKRGSGTQTHPPVLMVELLAQCAATRQDARETRERAVAMRRDDVLRRMRLGMSVRRSSV